MGLITINTANLLNGVSQQADALRRPTQAIEQINAVSSLVEGLRKRPPLDHLATITGALPSDSTLSDYYGFIINRDDDEKHYVRINTNTSVADLDITNLVNLSASVTVKDAGGATASGTDFDYLRTADAKRDIRHLTIDDYTFIINKSIVPAYTSSQEAALTPAALLFVQEVREAAVYTVNIWNSASGTGAPDFTGTDTAAAADDQGDVTASLVASLNTHGANATYTYSSSGSLIYLKKTAGTDFRVEVITTYAGGFKMFKGSVDDLGSLPAEGWAGFKIKITGTADLGADPYWVQYESQNTITTGFTSGYWTECLGPSEYYVLNASTMPHVLISNGDGTFTFKAATWSNKLTGSSDAENSPSFIGEDIRGAFFHQDRLGFLTGESLVFSEVGSYFNFFRASMAQLLDSDPIDVQLSSTGISLLNYAMNAAEKLVVFSDTAQFVVGKSSTEGLSPSNIEAVEATHYTSFPNVQPEPIGKSIFFGAAKGQYSGMREYFVAENTSLFDGEIITDHVPRYIAGEIIKIQAIDVENTILLQTDGYTNGIYTYVFYNSGNERLQSAWSKFSFGDNTLVCDINTLGTKVYVLLKRGSAYSLECLDLAAGLTDAYSDTVVCLDRRVTDDDATAINYSIITNETTITLPYSVTTDDTMEIVTRYTVSVDGGVRLNNVEKVVGQPTKITVKGDYSTTPLYIGANYTKEYQMTKPTIRQQSGTSSLPVYTGRPQVRYATIALDDSSYIEVTVAPAYRTERSYKYVPRNVGTGDAIIGATISSADALLRVPIMTRNTDFVMTLRNDTPLASNVLGVTWEVDYYTRSRN